MVLLLVPLYPTTAVSRRTMGDSGENRLNRGKIHTWTRRGRCIFREETVMSNNTDKPSWVQTEIYF
ncbi:MAG: hypothetical protein ABIJ00_10495, partial [Candidatus Eisenbacteria bacterium]